MSFLTDITPRSEWGKKHEQLYRLLRSNSVFLSQLQGYKKPNSLDFLGNLPRLKRIVIEFPFNTISDGTVLSQKNDLEYIDLNVKFKKEVDLSSLDNLREARILYSDAIKSIFRNQNLQKITIINYPFSDLEALTGMVSLKRVRMINPKELESLKGLLLLPNIENISLEYESIKPKLRDISSYKESPKTASLFINDKKVYKAKDLEETEVEVIVKKFGAHRVDMYFIADRY